MSAPDSTRTSQDARTVALLKAISADAVHAADDQAFADELAKAITESFAVAAFVQVEPARGSANALAGCRDGIEELRNVASVLNEQLDSGGNVSTSSRAANSSANAQIYVTPLGVAKPRGYLLALVNSDSLSSRLEHLHTIKLAADVASGYFSTEQQAHSAGSMAALHRSLHLRTTCNTIANELRRPLDADRVSVYIHKGKRFQLISMSGQSEINDRANLVQALGKFVNRVAVLPDLFRYPAEEEIPPQIESDLQPYLDLSGVGSVTVIPLRSPMDEAKDTTLREPKPRQTIGALVLERFQSGGRTRIVGTEPSIQDAELALNNSLVHSNVFLLPLLTGIGRLLGNSPLVKIGAAIAAAALCLAALLLIKTDHFIHADGSLQPVNQSRMFAPSAGIVSDIHCKHGQLVSNGDRLLTLENAELDQEVEKILGELQIAQRRLNAATALRQRNSITRNQLEPNSIEQIAAEKQQLEVQIQHLEQQQELLHHEQGKLSVMSPIEGEVVTWDLEKHLRARPVNRGQLLVTVADINGPWRLELELPESQVQSLLDARESTDNALPIQFVLGTAPGQFHKASLTTVADTAQQHERLGVAVQLAANVDPEAAFHRRAGADVRAKIFCGKRSLGYVWLSDAWNFIRIRVLFYFS